MENSFREKAVSSQVTDISAELEKAEMVLLNSQRLNKVWVSLPSGKDEAFQVTLYENSDHDSDLGMVGCDFLINDHFYPDKKWNECRPFDEEKDELVGREFPLPPSKHAQQAHSVQTAAESTVATTPNIRRNTQATDAKLVYK